MALHGYMAVPTTGLILGPAMLVGGVLRWAVPGLRHWGQALIGVGFLAAGAFQVSAGVILAALPLLGCGLWFTGSALWDLWRGKSDEQSPAE